MISEEDTFRIIKKFGSPYRTTDRGMKYYKDIITKYLSGIPLKDEKLLLILGINVYAGVTSTEADLEIDGELINEIKQKIGVDPQNTNMINMILIVLFDKGYIEDNPTFDPIFNQKLKESVDLT